MQVTERTHLNPAAKAGQARLNSNKASVEESVVNIVKICIGTGMLALPYAVGESGVVAGAAGLALIGLWNLHASRRLCGLRVRLREETYATMAGRVFGPPAALIVDICSITTLLGVVCVYTITFAELLHDTPLALAPGGVATSAWR
jgi:amino acid permease